MYLLDISCSSPLMGTLLNAFKQIIGIAHIVVPILLLVSLALKIGKMTITPDDKKGLKKILNSILAAGIIFFIPMFVDLVMNMMGENFSVSSCWKSLSVPTGTPTTYVDPYPDQGGNSPIVTDPKDYEPGVQKITGGGSVSEGKTSNLQYFTYVPKNATENMPLLVYLHGDGGSISGAKSNSIGKTAEAAGVPAIVVQPYSPNMGSSGNPGWYEGNHLGQVRKIIDEVCSQYHCDTSNINIMGHSRGAIGTWMMVSKYPGLFHGAAPISCCASSGFHASSFKGVKVWAFRGSGAGSGSGNDDIYASCMKRSVNSIKPYASEWKYTIIPQTTHGGAGSYAKSNKALYQFLLKK